LRIALYSDYCLRGRVGEAGECSVVYVVWTEKVPSNTVLKYLGRYVLAVEATANRNGLQVESPPSQGTAMVMTTSGIRLPHFYYNQIQSRQRIWENHQC
jgi:hypothetical protein